MIFLIAGKRGAVDLMKGFGHRVVLASIYIHYLPIPRVPRRKHLLASHSPPPTLPSPRSHSATLLSSFHHCAFSDSTTPTPSNWKKKGGKKNHPSQQVFSVKRPAERGELKAEELTWRSKWVQAWEGDGGGAVEQGSEPWGRETLTQAKG